MGILLKFIKFLMSFRRDEYYIKRRRLMRVDGIVILLMAYSWLWIKVVDSEGVDKLSLSTHVMYSLYYVTNFWVVFANFRYMTLEFVAGCFLVVNSICVVLYMMFHYKSNYKRKHDIFPLRYVLYVLALYVIMALRMKNPRPDAEGGIGPTLAAVSSLSQAFFTRESKTGSKNVLYYFMIMTLYFLMQAADLSHLIYSEPKLFSDVDYFFHLTCLTVTVVNHVVTCYFINSAILEPEQVTISDPEQVTISNPGAIDREARAPEPSKPAIPEEPTDSTPFLKPSTPPVKPKQRKGGKRKGSSRSRSRKRR